MGRRVKGYLLQRLALLPLTLFCIILVNFVILNLAPGEPTSSQEISQSSGVKRESAQAFFFAEDRWLQFREFYGLTLPLLWNVWPFQSYEETLKEIEAIVDGKELPPSQMNAMRRDMGDKARYQMENLLQIISDSRLSPSIRTEAARFFRRGGFRLAYLGHNLTEEERRYNRRIEESEIRLASLSPEEYASWFKEEKSFLGASKTRSEKWKAFFLDTRFCRYFSRVLTLNFGQMRKDATRSVVEEVASRLKISLTLSIIPMFVAFFVSLLIGFWMALYQGRWIDRWGNLLLLLLWSLPVYVVAPFLIDRFALHGSFPISGFSSLPDLYDRMTSLERLKDILHHLFLPFIAVIYSGFAFQSRLTRNVVLEVLHQEYVRYGYLKGLNKSYILFFYVGKAASIPLVTSLASSFGLILSGSLIVETLFEIDGFGRFFYQAVIDRDYNVVMFSQLVGSFLALLGFLIADLLYIALDPRMTFHEKKGEALS